MDDVQESVGYTNLEFWRKFKAAIEIGFIVYNWRKKVPRPKSWGTPTAGGYAILFAGYNINSGFLLYWSIFSTFPGLKQFFPPNLHFVNFNRNLERRDIKYLGRNNHLELEVSCRTVNYSDSESKLNDRYPYSKCTKLKVSWRKAVFPHYLHNLTLLKSFNRISKDKEVFQAQLSGSINY